MLDSVGTEFEVSPEDLRGLRDADPDLVILDCRQPEEWAMASLQGTTNIPMREIPSRLGELDPERDIVVMCHHGVRSLNVTLWLRQQVRFPRVKSLKGGIDAWSQHVDPKLPRY